MSAMAPIEAYTLAELFDSAMDGVFVSDDAGRYLYVNPAGARLLGYAVHELIGVSVSDVIDLEDAPRVAAWRASEPRTPQRGEWRLRRRDGAWIDVEITSRLLPDNRWFGTVRDITVRKENDERLQLLAREVDHRANNLLAVVQSAITLSRADSAQGLKQALIGRISALARTHQLLADARWVGADLRRLVDEELRAFCGPEDGRVLIDGPPQELTPHVAQAVAMAIHELATNAVKHGALSAPGGRVEVSWRAAPGEPPVITWRERGGPKVAGEPERRGLGTTLLQRALRGTIGGRTEMDWAPEGLVCRLWLG
jgi:PAS domain S-box-containing protein